MSNLPSGVILLGILIVFFISGYLFYRFLTSCSNKQMFNKRHDIRLIETEQSKLAICIECGGRWELDEVDEAIFITRARRRCHAHIDI